MDHKLQKRIERAANASLFIYAVSVMALPICLVNIKNELGFSLTQAGALGFISTLEQFVILILSGFIAARYGKIRVLKSALLILASGLLLFTQISSYILAVSIILVIGLGNAFIEALLTPLIEDIYPQDNGSKQNMLHSFWPIGVLVSTLIMGELLSREVSWRWIFAGIACAVSIIILFYPSSKKVKFKRSKIDFSHFKDVLTQPKFILLGLALFFAGGAEGGVTFWLASYIQLNLGGLPSAGGIGTAFFALGMFTGRIATSKLTSWIKLKTIIRISALLALLSAVSFFFISNIITLYLSVFLTGITFACFWPSLQTYTVREIPLDPTIIMILMSCFGLIGFSSVTLLMGIIGDISNLKFSFIVIPAYLSALIVIIFIEGRIHFKEEKKN